MKKCKFCKIKEGESQCLAYAGPDTGFNCTRPKGHDGPHIACGCIDHIMYTWDQEPDGVLADPRVAALVEAAKMALDVFEDECLDVPANDKLWDALRALEGESETT